MEARGKRRRFPLRTILLAVAGLWLGITVYNWNAASLVGNRMPMPFGYGISVVLSGSMEPTLSVDDAVIVRQTDTVEVGDVVVYQSGGELIIHRVVFTDGDTVLTQGDANNWADDQISISQIKGKMTACIPGIGVIIRVLKKPAVMIAFFVLAFLLAEASYRRNRERDDEQLDRIKDEIRQLREETSEPTRDVTEESGTDMSGKEDTKQRSHTENQQGENPQE